MKNKYIFILSLTFLCSMLLALFSEGLKDKTLFNRELDKKKNILETVGLFSSNLSDNEIIDSFNENIEEITLDISGNILSDIEHSKLNFETDNKTGESIYSYLNVNYLPAYLATQMNAVIIPISGKGLWSTMYGYIAVDLTNFSTLKGITFYQHGETPGLGAEITKDWFKSSFVGKELDKDSEFESISVKKAGNADKSSLYEVDGISGATITSRGVENLLRRDLLKYQGYFRKNK